MRTTSSHLPPCLHPRLTSCQNPRFPPACPRTSFLLRIALDPNILFLFLLGWAFVARLRFKEISLHFFTERVSQRVRILAGDAILKLEMWEISVLYSVEHLHIVIFGNSFVSRHSWFSKAVQSQFLMGMFTMNAWPHSWPNTI